MKEDSIEQVSCIKDGLVTQSIDSVTALMKAIPIYEDALQPLAKETGKALATVGKAVNAALAPISLVIWGYDKISNFLEIKLSEKLQNVPENCIETPPLNIVGPAIEALRFSGEQETLQNLYANLISNSLDSRTVKNAHPSFINIIKNISPDEGLILKLFVTGDKHPLVDIKRITIKDGGFEITQRNVCAIGQMAGCMHQDLASNYIENLCRLGILEIPHGQHLNKESLYSIIIGDVNMKNLVSVYEASGTYKIGFDKKYIQATGYGKQFIDSCVVNKNKSA